MTTYNVKDMKLFFKHKQKKKMLESRSEDALVLLVKLVKSTVETVETVES